MKLPLSAKGRAEFRPRGEDGPVYFLKVPTILEAEDYRAELTIAGFRYPNDGELFDIMVRELEARGAQNAGENQFGALIDLVDNVRAFMAEQEQLPFAERAPLPDDLAQPMADLEGKMRAASEDYRRALASRQSSLAKMYIIAAKQFLRGWTIEDGDGAPIPFEADIDGRITEECLSQAMHRDRDQILAVGAHAASLTRPEATARKNSPSLSRSSQSLAASMATAPRTAAEAGKSTGSSSKRTLQKA